MIVAPKVQGDDDEEEGEIQESAKSELECRGSIEMSRVFATYVESSGRRCRCSRPWWYVFCFQPTTYTHAIPAVVPCFPCQLLFTSVEG